MVSHPFPLVHTQSSTKKHSEINFPLILLVSVELHVFSVEWKNRGFKVVYTRMSASQSLETEKKTSQTYLSYRFLESESTVHSSSQTLDHTNLFTSVNCLIFSPAPGAPLELPSEGYYNPGFEKDTIVVKEVERPSTTADKLEGKNQSVTGEIVYARVNKEKKR